MADGFEPYHVPQQSRRDKLRVISFHSHPACAAVPIYHNHHHLISSDLITCADDHHNPTTTSSATCSSNHLYMDPHSSSLNLNPVSINNNPFLFNTNFHGGSGGEVGAYGRPETLVTQEPNTNTTFGQGLSLSLSSQRYDSSMYSTTKVTTAGDDGDCFFLPPSGSGSGSGSDELSRNPIVVVPLGPFTGYASVLKGSKFLQPAQQLLDEISDVGTGIIYSEKLVADSDLHMDPQLECFSPAGNIVDHPKSCTVVGENRRKKSRLMSMLDEVYKRYKQYYQQMQAVVASFESVSGVRNAAPFANLALKAMSKHFGYLKNAITDQLQFITESHISREKDTVPIGGFENPGMDVKSHRRIQNNIGFVDHHHHQPVWRPQRGLPERAVTVLRAWLFEHFLHPYPTDTDKLMLAKQTGLSRNQVSNWFINARVRLWKPMVEEIHMLETRQGQKSSRKEELIAERQNNAVSGAISNTGKMATSTQSHQRIEEIPSKRTRNHDLPQSSATGIPTGNEQATMNLPYHHKQPSRHQAYLSGGGAGGVSLTLGLHQNNGIGLSDPFPINAARRLGLESNTDGYVMAGIDAQNQQFRREIIGGGQFLHDFVG